jgi:hypothetical protein
MSIWMNPGTYSLMPFFLVIASFSSVSLARRLVRPFALRGPVQTGARHIRIDEASGDHQQVIQRQIQPATQFGDNQFLRGRGAWRAACAPDANLPYLPGFAIWMPCSC